MRTFIVMLLCAIPVAAQDNAEIIRRLNALELKLEMLFAMQNGIDGGYRQMPVTYPQSTLSGGWVLQADGSYMRRINYSNMPYRSEPMYAPTVQDGVICVGGQCNVAPAHNYYDRQPLIRRRR